MKTTFVSKTFRKDFHRAMPSRKESQWVLCRRNRKNDWNCKSWIRPELLQAWRSSENQRTGSLVCSMKSVSCSKPRQRKQQISMQPTLPSLFG